MVKYILSDLQFILDQILIAERHANGENLSDILPHSELARGLRTVDGSFNHLVPGQSTLGSADQQFPRMLDPVFRPGENAIFGPPLPTHYSQKTGMVVDSQPRTISNLIVDQTPNNPAAVALAGSAGDDGLWGTADDVLNDGVSVVVSPGLDGVAGDDPDTIGIDESADDKLTFKFDNVTPDEGLSAPFNSWMTFFGQFFDHGLDLVTKGNSGTVFIPLKPDDPLYVEGSHTNFMILTRATNLPGPDGITGDDPTTVVDESADDEHEHTNTTSPFVDQNQTYSSHPSHQVFLRAYEARPLNIGTEEAPVIVDAPFATGGLLTSPEGGMATWGVLKAQARDLLGIDLTDADVFNVPLLATDAYGNFIRGENGFPQVVMRTAGDDGDFGTADDGTELLEGNPAAPISLELAIRTGHAFLDDIAHSANPAGGKLADSDGDFGITNPNEFPNPDYDPDLPPGTPGNTPFLPQYDNELLDAHYVAGDGRVNENIGLTAVHAVFHAEHNRLLEETKSVALASGDLAFLSAWLMPGTAPETFPMLPEEISALVWNGERLFQAAKFGTEMQYQHLVFEEFARTIQPNVDAFIDFNDTIDPSIVAEFAHTVYRFGHSMLTETVDRYGADFTANPIDLISAFLNPLEFAASGATPEEAAAAIIRGVTRDVGNEIDEFVTEALRNNLVGLPLDLAAINLARGRDTGVPSLNAARREFYNGTGDAQLKPYISWVDFGMNIKHPESLINFIAAYGKHALFSDSRTDTLAEKRAVAFALMFGGEVTLTDSEGVEETLVVTNSESHDFLHGPAATTGVDDIDLWIGGLAEAKMPFGGMLGSTFNFVFETQLEALQDGDRFYYLHRLAGTNFFNELENNSFSSIIQKNMGVAHLPALVFSTPAYTLEADQTQQFTGLGDDGRADPTGDDPLVPLVSRDNPEPDGFIPYTNYLKYTGDDHVVLGGTNDNDILISSIGDDTVYGDGGKDRIEGGYGNDDLQGGDGDDIITDMGGDDVLKGGAGNDVIHGGNGINLIIGGAGSDFIITGEDSSEAFAGEGNDFILAAKTDPVIVGNEGDDWIEGGLSDGAPGDTFDPFGNDPVAGNDVFIGDSAADETLGEGGDDIVIGTEGPDKYDGGSGFDWVTYKDDRFGVSVDLNVAAFNAAPLPVSVAAILTEFENNEGLSGSSHSDVLRGNDDDAAGIAAAGTRGSVLTNIALIDGLQEFLDNAFGFSVSSFGSGNIILGGDGSDFIEGRGGDDIIDGDMWLNVRVSVRSASDHSIEIDTVDRIADLVPRMLSGEINPSQLEIVRELKEGTTGAFNFDTAVFSGNLADYDVSFGDNGVVRVSDSVVGRDGTDRLVGIERLQFADGSVTLPGFEGLNADPVGLATIDNPTPASGETVTASIAGVTDADNPGGAITGAVAFYWQFEPDPGTGVFVDIVNEAAGAPIPSRTLVITPDLEGLALRVRAVYQDAHGVMESVVSAPTALVDVGAPPAPPAPAPDMTVTADSEGVRYIRSDLQFILDSIKIAEAHAGGADLLSLVPNYRASVGLRTVDGSYNNLTPGQEDFGAADRVFPRMTDPNYINVPGPTSYAQTSGTVVDAAPRTISNLIVDQTANNDAAYARAYDAGEDGELRTGDDVLKDGVSIVVSPGLDGIFDTDDDVEVFQHNNVAPDEGLSAPFNSWMTFFGQFFDHGLDLVTKGGAGTVFIPLQPDDPLFNAGIDGIPGNGDDGPNFMMLTRATNVIGPGEDGILGTTDDTRDNINTTSPFIDQNQTYSSHPSHQVFLRAYHLVDGKPVATGELIENRDLVDGVFGNGDDIELGGMATWGVVKAQARDILGINLTDADVNDVPLLVTDEYGNFLKGTNGFPVVMMADGSFVEGDPSANGGLGISLVGAARTGHAFLDDIAHTASPRTSAGVLKTADADDVAGGPVASGEYDNELLDAHYIAGDGRVNENIGLTAVHSIFHSEHNRLVQHTKDVALATGDIAFLNEWLDPNHQLALDDPFPASADDLVWNGERLFQAAKFGTEMQYQHLVFEEFGRLIQPNIDVFLGGQINYDANIDPSIVAEFAHVVYRFGHSMLTETLNVTDANFVNSEIGLIAAFLNPLEFAASGPTPDQAVGAIVRGVTRDVGNEIDEFVTEALRNNLVGLPLDLASLNLARGRDTGIPSLNAARRDFYEQTGDSNLKPYSSWVDFVQHIKNPESLINFIAAYGTHSLITSETTLEGKRAAAMAIVFGTDQAFLGDPDTADDDRTISPPLDALDFLNSTGDWANAGNGATITGVDGIDFWIGGLAEEKMPFGGMLGSTFNFVFETQMEALQNADRFYYLDRTSGLNFLTELENNTFARLIAANSDAKHLAGNVFTTPAYFLEVDQSQQFNEGLGNLDPDSGDPLFPLVIRVNPTDAGDTNYLQFTGGDHVVLGGTDLTDDTLVGSIGDDTLWGDDGNDKLEGGYGNDMLFGGKGDDILTDKGGDDNLQGGDGDDVLHGGNGLDLLLGGHGNDFIATGEDLSEAFGGTGNDFLLGSTADELLVGNEGDDWIESGSADGAAGDNLDLNGLDLVAGNDVFIGDGMPNGMAGEGGDDIFVGSSGAGDRYDGASGFDWATFKDDGFGVNIDLNVRAFDLAPIPPSAASILARFDGVEGISGSAHSDILRGDDEDAIGIATAGAQGSTLTNIGLITGLQELLDTMLGGPVESFNAGNIILGGDGSDIIEGRGGNDLIDGDKWLNVRISVRANDDGTGIEIGSYDNAADLVAKMVTGEINPGQLVIMREILNSTDLEADPVNGPDFDTASFRGNRADYTVVVDTNGTALDFSDDVITVTDNVAGRDGVDTLMNIERLRFADQSIVLSGLNNAPEGLLEILDDETLTPDNTPTEDQTLRVSIAGVTDADNPGDVVLEIPPGAITGPIVYYWQIELDPGSGVFEDILLPGGGEEARATGLTFTPGDAEVGLRLRVKAVYQDGNGVLEEVFSAPTQPVINENDFPGGGVFLSDTTPAEDAFITALNNITDADGLTLATFAYQWQHFDEDLPIPAWVDIAGANFEFFAPDQEQVGRTVRVVVTYTDDLGALETVMSDPTAAVTNTNDLPSGTLDISDITPTETQVLTAEVNFTDQDGISGPLAFQWQAFDGTDWINIDGATSNTFTPTQAQVNHELRVVVTYTDDFGIDERIESLPTIVTGDFIAADNASQTLNGTEGQDVIFGGGGTDTLNGGGEDDILDGGNGIDTLNGGDGNDVLAGGNGDDTINGGAGNDTIEFRVNEETDTVDGGDDIDTMNVRGNANDNTMRVLFDGSVLTRIAGGAVTNVEVVNLDLEGGTDTLNYNPQIGPGTTVGVTVDLAAGVASGFASIAGVENATGGSGDDLFIGDAANNRFVGGTGRDTYSLAGTTAGATITSGSATSAEAGSDILQGIEDYIGSQGNDSMLMNGGSQLIDGQAGNDTLNGGAGADTILGGAGNDTILYNLNDGADTVDGGADTDTLVINGGAGGQNLAVVFDGTRLTTVALGAISNVEIVTLNMQGGTDTLNYSTTTAGVTVNLATGTGSGFASIANVENVIGGSGNDVFTSGTGGNTFQGGTGADRFVATLNDGNDRFEGGTGVDTLDLSGTNANATVTANLATSAQIGNDQLFDIENVIGGGGNDTITLNVGANTVDGGGGADTIITGAGADIIQGGAGNDTISGGTGNDQMNGGAGTDTFLFTTNFGNDTITGFDFNPGGGGGGPGQDILRLNPALGINAGNFLANVTWVQQGADTVITIGSNTITLLGVQANQIDQTDFTFGP